MNTARRAVIEEIVAYIRTEKEQGGTSVFKLIDLNNLYSRHLNEPRQILESRFNTTHLKETILLSCPLLHDVFIAFKDNIGACLQSYAEDSDVEGRYLVRAFAII